jgi:type VI secretion system protein ImpE
MMLAQAENALQQGNLQAALLDLQNQIKKEPGNPKLRVFLFQLLAVTGQWERALAQLKVLSGLDALSLLMVKTYEAAVQCEALRAEVFAGRQTPLIFGEPQQWLALLIEALRLDAEGHEAEALNLRNQAFEQAPASSGSINGEEFAWVADADSRLGPVVEGIFNGRYYWIPFSQISKIQIEAPADLRDVVWMPVQFTWINGGEASGLIPTRYPGAERSEDNQIRLARKTEWEENSAGGAHGRGQRLLATDVQDYALMDIRKIEFHSLDGSN